MHSKFKTISSKELYHNPYWDYYLDRYSIDNREFDYHYVRSRGSVMIIPLLDNGNLLLIEQYRYLNNRPSIELPGGGVGPNTDYKSAAAKELEEETGYIANDLEFIGEFNPCNGITNEICKVYIARNLVKVTQKNEETEEIQVLNYNINDIEQLIKSNKIWDGMSISSLYIYLSQYKNLV